MGDKDKDLALTFTLKDKDGKTFTNVDSLKIETQVSDDSILSLETAHPTIPEIELSKFAKVNAKRKSIENRCIKWFLNAIFVHYSTSYFKS